MPITSVLLLILLGLGTTLSAVCFCAYAIDKRAAIAGRRRVTESTLLLLGLAGGWPGALLAQQWLRHKTRKNSFRIRFWLSVLANLGGLALLLAAATAGST